MEIILSVMLVGFLDDSNSGDNSFQQHILKLSYLTATYKENDANNLSKAVGSLCIQV